MIARIWRGWAPLATAGDYERHYRAEVGGHLRAVSGFRGARLLRQQDGQEVMFTSITYFSSLDAVPRLRRGRLRTGRRRGCRQAGAEPLGRAGLAP